MAATTSTPLNDYVMTPPLLSQLWRSYGGSTRISSLTIFSQGSDHVFSNYAIHPPVTMVLPDCCRALAVINNNNCNNSCNASSSSTSSTTSSTTSSSPSSSSPISISFDFAEKAIMACKAALFRDYQSFRTILDSKDPREAKALGRNVAPFDETTWNQHRCTIVKHVVVAKMNSNTTRNTKTNMSSTTSSTSTSTSTSFRSSLLQTGDDTIAECTPNDWVWGTALDPSDPNVFYPGRWRGLNILGWALMEARDEARKKEQRELLQQQRLQQQRLQQQQTTPDDPNSIKYLAALYSFGTNAFGPLQQSNAKTKTNSNQHKHLHKLSTTTNGSSGSHSVKDVVETSFPLAKTMRGERGNKSVVRMLTDIYEQGLFMHGNADSSVNATIIPSLRHVVHQLQTTMDAHDPKRVAMVRDLVEACQDCQQVQARVILRLYGDLTSQNATLDSQLHYSLVPSKEQALQTLITKHHGDVCDQDHTRVGPERQRAHLWSGYLSLIGDAFGLDGVVASNGDRFLHDSLGVIRDAHTNNGRVSSSSKKRRFRFGHFGLNSNGNRNGNTDNDDNDKDNDDDGALKTFLLTELTQQLCVKEWLSTLLGDINNQSSDADRRINRSCIFDWANTNMPGDFKHRIFYDDDRSEEYSDLDPGRPTGIDNQYEPFLSPLVLVQMLVKAGMLEPL